MVSEGVTVAEQLKIRDSFSENAAVVFNSEKSSLCSRKVALYYKERDIDQKWRHSFISQQVSHFPDLTKETGQRDFFHS
jgi:hypothetical protein